MLLRSASPEAGDDKRALESLAGLDRKPEDLPELLALVMDLARRERLSDGIERLTADLQDQHIAWARARAEADAELKRLTDEIEGRVAVAFDARNAAEHDLQEARRARAKLAALRDSWEAVIRGVPGEVIWDEKRTALRTAGAAEAARVRRKKLALQAQQEAALPEAAADIPVE